MNLHTDIRLFQDAVIAAVTNKKGMIRKTAHQYQRQNFTGVFGQVREHIVVEATWLGSSEPYTTGVISCYVTDMMQRAGQGQIVEKYRMQPFPVKMLSKERTLCEKIMSLVRFSQSNSPYDALASKIRHVYDIHMMLKDQSVSLFFDSPSFETMLIQVGKDDMVSFKHNNTWLVNHPGAAILFRSSEDSWNRIKHTYRTSFKDLVLGELPDDAALVHTLKRVSGRLETVRWPWSGRP